MLDVESRCWMLRQPVETCMSTLILFLPLRFICEKRLLSEENALEVRG